VAAPEQPFAVVGLTGSGAIGEPTRLLPVRLRREHYSRALADELARISADHILEEAVAALDRAVADERDAHRRVVEDQLLLAERALHALLGLVLLRDVLEQPHRALRRVAGLQRLHREQAPDPAAVAPGVLAQHIVVLALPERLVQRLGAHLYGVPRTVAEQLLEAPVAVNHV